MNEFLHFDTTANLSQAEC